MRAEIGVEIGAATVRPVRLFYSYSHRDEEFRSAPGNAPLGTAAEPACRRMARRHDRRRRRLERRDRQASRLGRHRAVAGQRRLHRVGLLLERGMTKALQRHERGEARVVPVILRPCRWRSTPLAKLQAVPKDGKPVTDWLNQDTAFDDVAAAIQCIIEDQQQERLRVGGRSQPQGRKRSVCGPKPKQRARPRSNDGMPRSRRGAK